MSITDKNYYRGVRKSQFPDGPIVAEKPVVGVLYPDFEDVPIENKSGGITIRPADVKPDNGKIHPGAGTSLFDGDRFKGPAWWSFVIPIGTVVPDSLVIKPDDSIKRKKLNHYMIEVRNTMPHVAYKGALDHLARRAVVRQIEIAKSGETK